ncbi:LRR domain containing protein [Parasponia andersonii]|uniref:LRR domain containing protein n=1 Tax=Parasponia andersonii TaxID=3476 RepID=A0A2P5DM68_PARAD|nr:LRR domain containing protein [Parasponia andersonii]
MPPQTGNLKQLQTLPEFILSENDHSSSIKELGDLQQLGGQLCISGLQNVNNFEDVLKADLKGKKNLSKLVLKCKGDQTIDIRREQYDKALEALQPHKNLERLDIYEYPGSKFPSWVGNSEFSNMLSMSLVPCRHWGNYLFFEIYSLKIFMGWRP